MQLILLITGLMAICKPLNCDKWPDPKDDKVIYVSNPIEADLPSHWIPLSVIKRVIELRVPTRKPQTIKPKHKIDMTVFKWKLMNKKVEPGTTNIKSPLKLLLSITSTKRQMSTRSIPKNTVPDINNSGDSAFGASDSEENDEYSGKTLKDTTGNDNDHSNDSFETNGDFNQNVTDSNIVQEDKSLTTQFTRNPLTNPNVKTISLTENSANISKQLALSDNSSNDENMRYSLSTIGSLPAVTSPMIDEISTMITMPSTTVDRLITVATPVTSQKVVATTTPTTTIKVTALKSTTTITVPLTTKPTTKKPLTTTTTTVPSTTTTVQSTTTKVPTTTRTVPSTIKTTIPSTTRTIPSTTTTVQSTTTTEPTTTIPSTITTVASTTTTITVPSTTTTVPSTTTTKPTTTTLKTSPTTTSTKTTEYVDYGDPFY